MQTSDNNDCCRVSVEELIKNLPLDETLERNAILLKSLADETRLKIVYLLKNGELCACEILESIDKAQSTVSHHLNIMKKEGVLSSRKQGTWIYYKLADGGIIENLENLFNTIR